MVFPVDEIVAWISSMLSALRVWITGSLGSVWDTIWGGLVWLRDQVNGGMDYMLRDLRTRVLDAQAWMTDRANYLWGLVGPGISGLSTQLSSVGASVVTAFDGALRGFGDTVAAALRGIWDGLSAGFGAVWAWLRDVAGPAVSGALVTAGASIKGAWEATWSALTSILNVSGPVQPERALATAIATAIPAMGLNFGLYLATTTTDLLHPIKGTGIIPMGIDIIQGLGTKMLTGSVIGAYADVVLEGPLKLWYQSLARPYRPRGAEADQLHFEGQISKAEWEQLYAYAGWPDDLRAKKYEAMWIEPSDRLLMDVFTLPGVSRAWRETKLREKGYSAEDITVLLAYGEAKALERSKSLREGVVLTRYREGYITPDQAYAELSALGFRADQVSQIISAGALARDTDERKARVDNLIQAYRRDLLSDDELYAQLTEYIVNGTNRALLLEREQLRKIPAPRRTAA